MTPAILILISLMWLPIGLMFLGKGEIKGTGFATAVVGTLTIVGAFVEAAVFDDPLTAGLLFVHGIFYCSVSYAFLRGLEDLRGVGNVSLTTAIVSTVYALVFLIGTPLIEVSIYLGIMCVGYAVLTYMVWLNAFEKFSAKTIGWSLIVWTVFGLWVPAFWVLGTGVFPL